MSGQNESPSLPRPSGMRNAESPRLPSDSSNNNIPEYPLEYVLRDDWFMFSWFASVQDWRAYIHLFIVIWDKVAIKPEYDNLKELKDESDLIKEYIDELYSFDEVDYQYEDLLDNYCLCRENSNRTERKRLANDSLQCLNEFGLRNPYEFTFKISRLRSYQRKSLRKIIIRRLESFTFLLSRDDPQTQRQNPDTKALEDEIKRLKDENESLNKQNSKYQAALGNVRNIRWNDNDPNNTVELSSDIQEIQSTLFEFTMVQGKEFKIDYQLSTELLSKFGCKSEFPSPQAQLALSAILQRCAIEDILEGATSYFKYTSGDGDGSLEADINTTTEKVISLMEKFSIMRPGEDDATKMTPIKLRQQVYSALGSRSFSNPDNIHIRDMSTKLLEKFSQYRQILDEELRSELEDQSIQIILDVIHLFYFRLKVQPVALTYRFFESGECVDARYMQGSWVREDPKKLEVEVCSFPLICISEENDKIQKVLTRAHVITRPKAGNGTSLISSVKNLITRQG